MSVTVVVPTTGRSPLLRRSLGHMTEAAALTGPDAEVLVVVNGTDSVPGLHQFGSPLLRVVCSGPANVARARNVGIAAARHDTVIFGDDGGACVPTWCVDLASALRDPLFPVVTAPVRVPVSGPVTAFLNHQRVFDAPPVDEVEARTVTGHCAIRRDRLPATVRYDEENLPLVGEDVAFGHALRAAGIRIRWLTGFAPGLHLLPERPEEITERLFRYGRGAALVWSRGGDVPVPSPADVLALYQSVVRGEYRQYRRFSEVIAPDVRAAFTVYDVLHDVAFLLGYLAEHGGVVDLDHDGLRPAWQQIAARAAHATSQLSRDDWSTVLVDYARLDCGVATHDPLVAEVQRSLARYAPLRQDSPPWPVAARAQDSDGAAVTPDFPRLLAAWRELRATATPIDADAVDRRARAVGFGFRDACAVIERSALRRVGATTAAAATAGQRAQAPR